MPDLVLASSSPRRALLLSAAGYSFTTTAPDVDEATHAEESPEDAVLRLARAKALVPNQPGAVVLAADTAVVLEGETLGKPRDRDHAIDMLRRLGGRTHVVITGWAIATAQTIGEDGFDATLVTMRDITQQEAETYVDGGEPMDKAGAYALQGEGKRFVTGIAGSRSNVIGLPLRAVVPALERAGVNR
jgi:septum formation protein